MPWRRNVLVGRCVRNHIAWFARFKWAHIAFMVNLRLRTAVLVNRSSVWYKSFALQQARDGAHHTFADGKWVFTRFFVC